MQKCPVPLKTTLCHNESTTYVTLSIQTYDSPDVPKKMFLLVCLFCLVFFNLKVCCVLVFIIPVKTVYDRMLRQHMETTKVAQH